MCTMTLSGCTGNSGSSSDSGHQHKYSLLISEVPATCVDNGMKAHYECNECGQLFDINKNEVTREQLVIPALGHNPGNIWYEEGGYHFHLCNRCGGYVDVATHTLSEVNAQEADHEHGGLMHYYTCDVCHQDFLDSQGKVSISNTHIAPLGHDETLTYHPEVPATCEKEGTKAYYSCSCGALFEDENGTRRIENPIKIPAKGHIHNGFWYSNETKHWHECHYCDEIIDEENHTPGTEVYQDLENTWKICTVCGQKVDIQPRQITGCHHEHLMHYEQVYPTLSKPGHIAFHYCIDCDKSFYDAACTQEIPNTQYGIKDKRDGRYLSPVTGTFSVLNSNLRDYFAADTDQEIIAALKNNKMHNFQAKKVVNWEDNLNGPFTFEYSHDREFTSVESYVTNINAYTFEGVLTPGETYYYRVKDSSNKYLLDDLSFKVDDTYTLRTVTVDGLYNVRDLGGWSAKDGHKVLYGKLFRGGKLTDITTKGKETFLDTLGIKTEIDLRREGTKELDDPRLSYNKCDMRMYTEIIPGYSIYTLDDPSVERPFDELTPASLKNAFEILADSNNYPVYFHCAAGADRTGTFAYLVNGLLGVEYANLINDFEMTTFSVYGDRYRSGVTENNTFDDTGVLFNNNDNWCGFGLMNDIMQARYGEDGQPTYVAIENYLKEVCHISDATIASVRLNLLGETINF